MVRGLIGSGKAPLPLLHGKGGGIGVERGGVEALSGSIDSKDRGGNPS